MGKEFDFEVFKAKALEQMYAGVPLTGKDGGHYKKYCVNRDPGRKIRIFV